MATLHNSPSVGGAVNASSSAGQPVLEEGLLILKWGGVLTHAGRQQAEDLGKIYRMVMYPRCGLVCGVGWGGGGVTFVIRHKRTSGRGRGRAVGWEPARRQVRGRGRTLGPTQTARNAGAEGCGV